MSECGTGGKPVPLMRKNLDGQIDGATALTKIFDYRSAFLPALESYRAGIGPKPSPTVYLLFGFAKNLHDLQASQGGLIYATVTSIKALASLAEFPEGQVRYLRIVFIITVDGVISAMAVSFCSS